jgi:hypothetical protein
MSIWYQTSGTETKIPTILSVYKLPRYNRQKQQKVLAETLINPSKIVLQV